MLFIHHKRISLSFHVVFRFALSVFVLFISIEVVLLTPCMKWKHFYFYFLLLSLLLMLLLLSSFSIFLCLFSGRHVGSLLTPSWWMYMIIVRHFRRRIWVDWHWCSITYTCCIHTPDIEVNPYILQRIGKLSAPFKWVVYVYFVTKLIFRSLPLNIPCRRLKKKQIKAYINTPDSFALLSIWRQYFFPREKWII